MKRTNLVLDEDLLKTATRVLGAKTYSSAVNMALSEAIRVAQVKALEKFVGSGVWEGDLPDMRGDTGQSIRRKSGANRSGLRAKK